MKTVAELLQHIFTIAGIDPADENLKKAVVSTSAIELPENGLNSFNSKFITIDEAPAKVKDTLFAQFRNGEEAWLNQQAQALGFEIDPAQKNFRDKLTTAFKKLKESQAKGDEPEKIKKYTEQINELTAKLSAIQAETAKAVNDALAKQEKEFDSERVNNFLISELSKHNLSGIHSDPDISRTVARSVIDKAFNESKITLVRGENGSFRLAQQHDPNLDYFEKNQKIAPENYIKNVLVNAKLVNQQNPDGDKKEGKQRHLQRKANGGSAYLGALESEQFQE
jgi:hypothetical protein